MSALNVLSVEDAKAYLNIPAANTRHNAELPSFIGPAVERVERHQGKPAGSLAVACSASELLAVKVVLGDYWRTQRPEVGTAAGYAGSAVEDTTPSGGAPLRVRLAEILGPAASTTAAPSGSFPPPVGWPDPAGVVRTPR